MSGRNVTKINVSASALQSIIKDHPEIEVELLTKATDQVAQKLASLYTKENVDHRARVIECKIDERLNNKYKFPATVMELINKIVVDIVDKRIKDVATRYAVTRIDEAVNNRLGYIEGKCQKIVDDTVDRQVKEKLASLLDFTGAIRDKVGKK